MSGGTCVKKAANAKDAKDAKEKYDHGVLTCIVHERVEQAFRPAVEEQEDVGFSP